MTENKWTAGDIITSEATAEKLNVIEEKIAGGGSGEAGSFLVPYTADWDNDTITLNSTFKEIKDAAESGRMVLLWIAEDIEEHLYQLGDIFFAGMGPHPYVLMFYSVADSSMDYKFDCSDVNDYPVYGASSPDLPGDEQ